MPLQAALNLLRELQANGLQTSPEQPARAEKSTAFESPERPARAEQSTATQTLEPTMRAEKSTATESPEPPMREEKSTATEAPEPPMRAEKSTSTEDPVGQWHQWRAPSCNLELVVGNACATQQGVMVWGAPREYAGHMWHLLAVPTGLGPGEARLHIGVAGSRGSNWTLPSCLIEVVNWIDESKSRRYKLQADRRDTCCGSMTTDLELEESLQQEGYLGPDGALWLRAVLFFPAPSLRQVPALRENEVDFVVSDHRERVFNGETEHENSFKIFSKVNEDRGFKWRMSAARCPFDASAQLPIIVFLECLCPVGCDAALQPPPRAKYSVTIVNWLAWEDSVHVSGTADFTQLANRELEIALRPPAGEWTRGAGWVGPDQAIWLRASLTSVRIKHDFRFMPRDVVLALDAFKSMQELQLTGGLVTKTIELSPSCIGKYTEEYCAVSHYWQAPAQPDAGGIQLAALKRHLVANPSIQFVWFDFCCLPQRDSGTKRRNEGQEKVFRDGLKYVYLLFLNVSVLILYDLRFATRFWPLWEAWLAMHTPTASGLQLATAGPLQRWTIIDLKGDGTTQGAGSHLIWWVQEYPSQEKVFEYLARDDVSATNNCDKQEQLEVLRTIDADVQAALE